MSDKKQRVEISPDIAAEILFQSDRTCCVCRQRGRPTQLHHIDEDPSNNSPENLAVLCFDCHRETQIRGGFDRKLDAAQVKLYRADWMRRVEIRRDREQGAIQTDPIDRDRVLRYLQVREENDEYSYGFEADYSLIESSDSAADAEVNLSINAFITRQLQRFRADAITRTNGNEKNKKPINRDSLIISHHVSLSTSNVFSLEFQLWSYYAGAAHPNTQTQTKNFRLHPALELELSDIFKESSNYLGVLSRYSITDLHKQKAQRWPEFDEVIEQLKSQRDEQILSGASPKYSNFEHFSLTRNGIVIHFDTYSVGCHAEGKYEVFIPAYELKSVLREEIIDLLHWSHK
jgi:Protein of unknown function (DUF3298)/Deacetylase PdaC